MIRRPVTVLAAHVHAHRLINGATNRSAALLDRLILDSSILSLLSVSRVHPKWIYQGLKIQLPGFSRRILHSGPWGVFTKIERHEGHAVRRRYLLEHCYPYVLDDLLLQRIESECPEFGRGGRLLVFTPKEALFAEKFPARQRLFDTNDDWLLSPLMQNRFKRIQQGYDAAARMDTVFVTNPILAKKYPGHADLHYVPNAGHGPIPTPTHRCKVKSGSACVLLAGYYHPERLDLDALEEMMKSFPRVIFECYGSLDNPKLFKTLKNHSNFHFHGKVHVSTLRAKLADVDAALIPHPVTPYTLSQDMIKLYEYLGAGLPVVCPPIPPADRAAENGCIW